MTLIRPEDSYHKAQLLRLLTAIADNAYLANLLYFKGGTCASMLGYLDRFSVDLDFDLSDESKTDPIRKEFKLLFRKIGLEIKDESPKVLEFLLRYKAPQHERNSLRLDAVGYKYEANVYEPKQLPEINRTLMCQTKETMFAHKLVAITERYQKRESVAGRDIYDIHYFFINGYRYIPEIIEVRTKLKTPNYLSSLLDFIQEKITVSLLVSDLGTLLPKEKIAFIKTNLLQETIIFLKDEIQRIK